MKINKAYKYRLYPNKSQIKYIEGCFNACRYVYNVSLDCEQQLYELGAKSNLSAFGLTYHLKHYKKSDTWLKNYDSVALVYEMENLANSFQKFFKGGGYPRFKSKNEPKQSFRTRQAIELLNNGIKIPKVKTIIKAKIHREVEGKVKQMTISRENGKYYVSIMFEMEVIIPKIKIKEEVGIDMGVSHFMIRDDGIKIDNPKFLSGNKERMTKLQQKLSRAKKGSNNYKKIKNEISKLHKKTTNQRKDFLHNQSVKLVNEFDRIHMEDLNVSGMTRSAKGTAEKHGKNVKQKSGLNRNILDVGLGEFRRMVEYKSGWEGKEVVTVDRFFPSSKLCSNCGHKNDDLKLKDRMWTCPKCGETHDRDINSAKNIKAEGIRSLKN